MPSEKFQNTIKEIDRLNALDPHKEKDGDRTIPKELLYSQRMSSVLKKFEPNASETLQIAVRAQHIQRWAIPRDSYTMDRKGYLLWRTELKKFHGKLTAGIMAENGYSEDSIQHVDDLINKRRLKSDPEVQCLEDVVCLVFLEYYFDDFIAKHLDEEEKIIDIIRKTWKKMSEEGHKEALKIQHSVQSLALITKALS